MIARGYTKCFLYHFFLGINTNLRELGRTCPPCATAIRYHAQYIPSLMVSKRLSFDSVLVYQCSGKKISLYFHSTVYWCSGKK